jgi:hypothetical protein
MNAAVDSLTKASHRIAESLYKAQQSAGGAPGGSARLPAGRMERMDPRAARRKLPDKATLWMPSSWTWMNQRSPIEMVLVEQPARASVTAGAARSR